MLSAHVAWHSTPFVWPQQLQRDAIVHTPANEQSGIEAYHRQRSCHCMKQLVVNTPFDPGPVGKAVTGSSKLTSSHLSRSAVAEEHAAVFSADRTQNVIVRLRHNVIRTGLRRINLAYSRIGLADVAAKLGLPDAGDVECIVAKAIKCAAASCIYHPARALSLAAFIGGQRQREVAFGGSEEGPAQLCEVV